MKKTIALVLVFVMMLSTVAIAAPKINEKKVNEKLLEIGVPQEILNEMPLDYKMDVAENAVEFIGTEKVVLNESLVDGEIVPMGSIPSDQLDFYIDVYRTSESSDNRERFYVYGRFDWNSSPFWTLEDAIALQWDDDKWRPVDDSWKWSISYLFYGGSPITKKGYNCSDISNGGIYFHIDLRSGDYDTQYGYTRVMIESETPGYVSGSDEIYAKYVHNKISGSIGINFYSFGNIGVSGTSSYDERANMKTFSY